LQRDYSYSKQKVAEKDNEISQLKANNCEMQKKLDTLAKENIGYMLQNKDTGTRKRSLEETNLNFEFPQDKKRKKLSKFVIVLSGFGQGEKDYDNTVKENLKNIIIELGGEVGSDKEFDNSATHIVTPPRIKTMKAYTAMITGRWLVNPNWLYACHSTGKFISCEDYGVHGLNRPFKTKKFYILPLSTMDKGPITDYIKKNIRILIDRIGKGTIVNDSETADYIIVANDQEKEDYSLCQGEKISFKDFLSRIYKGFVSSLKE